MIKKVAVSSVSAFLSLGMIAPAFAYITPLDFIQKTARTVEQEARVGTYDRPTRRAIATSSERDILVEMQENTAEARVSSPARKSNLLRGTMERQFRRLNRQPKAGQDRYRILSYPNTRYFRLKAEQEQSSLPFQLVQTGGNNTYDRPTRRDIRENGYYDGIIDRDRDILQEMSESTR